MITLGVAFGYHDSSAAIVKDGQLLAASLEDRFTRQKHDDNFPTHAIKACLKQAGLTLADIDEIAFHEDPQLKFTRILCAGFEAFPHSRGEFVSAMKSWLGHKLWAVNKISKKLDIHPSHIQTLDHHLSHAANAFCGSRFNSAAIMVVDAVGDWACTATYRAQWTEGRLKIEKLHEVKFPHSLGLVYSAITEYLGFTPNDGECSTMALAAFGEPRFLADLEEIVALKEDGSYFVDQSYFNFTKFYQRGCSEKFIERFGPPLEKSQSYPFSCFDLEKNEKAPEHLKRFADMAASVQKLFERHIISTAQALQAQTGEINLCFAGGGALNCVANSYLLKETAFQDLYIPIDPGDGGSSIGAAYYLNTQRPVGKAADSSYLPYLGNEEDVSLDVSMIEHLSAGYLKRYSKESFGKLSYKGFSTETCESDEKLVELVARELAERKIVGWFQGRGEMGPRALGNRSILIRPDDQEVALRLSTRVKERAEFRPYALAMTGEESLEVLDGDYRHLSPYRRMQIASTVREEVRPQVSSCIHVDGTTRPQICLEDENPRFHALLNAYKKISGKACLLNTSFNAKGYPMVGTPLLALVMFVRSDMDLLVLDRTIIRKTYETA